MNRDTSTRRRRFGWLAVGLGLLPIVFAETALRLFAPAPGQADPYAAFGGNVPVFEKAGDVWRTSRAREPFLAPQEFAATKPDQAFRIFCFGGSTVYGRPFHTATAFPRWLELRLRAVHPDRPIEVVNCGGISYASYRIVPMVRECLGHEPDLVIVATGHNEFLEDRTYSALKERGPLRRALESLELVRRGRAFVKPAPQLETRAARDLRTRLDAESGYASYHRDDDWRQRVLTQFEESLHRIRDDCRAAGVPLLVARLGANLRDCPPFKSEHRAALSPADEAEWQRHFDRASELEAQDPDAALAAYQKALAIDDRFALLPYRIARLLDSRGRAEEAVGYYRAARDEDVCPLRMLSGQHAFLGTLHDPAGTATRVVDVDVDVGDPLASDQGVAGFDRYLDHVHPTIAGHQEIARTLAAEILAQHLPGTNLPEPAWSEICGKHFASLDPAYFGDGQRRLDWLEDWARRERLAREVKPRTAEEYFRRGARRLDFAALDLAAEDFRMARQLDQRLADRIAEHLAETARWGRAGLANSLRDRLAQK